MQVAAAQIDIALADKSYNLQKCIVFLGMAARQKAELVVFPECSISGYVFSSFDEAFSVSETVPGESTRKLEQACRKYGISAVFGLVERNRDRLYNTAVLVTPDGLAGKYHKTHIPVLGLDRYVSPGEELPVFSTPQGKVGIVICYDQRFPEPSRVLALKGARIILNPTNLPVGAEAYPGFLNQARACENRVYLISANRVGVERETRFIGRSQIVDYTGKVLAQGSDDREELLVAAIEPSRAETKHIVNRPGEYELDLFKDRRTELYQPIIHDRKEDQVRGG